MSITYLYFLIVLLPAMQGLNATFIIIGFIVLFIIFLSLMFHLDSTKSVNDEEIWKELKDICNKFHGKKVLFFTVIFVLVNLLLPSEQQIFQIYGLHYVSNNKDIKNLPNNAAKFLNHELTSYLKTKDTIDED